MRKHDGNLHHRRNPLNLWKTKPKTPAGINARHEKIKVEATVIITEPIARSPEVRAVSESIIGTPQVGPKTKNVKTNPVTSAAMIAQRVTRLPPQRRRQYSISAGVRIKMVSSGNTLGVVKHVFHRQPYPTARHGQVSSGVLPRAVEDHRTPGRFAFASDHSSALASGSAAALRRFEPAFAL